MNFNSRLINTTFILILLGVVLIFLIYFKDFFQPVVLAVFLWYLISSLQNWFRRFSFRKGRRMASWLASILSFILVISVLYGIVTLIQYNVNLIISRSKDYQGNLNVFISKIQGLTQGNENIKKQIENALNNIDIQSYLGSIVSGISGFLGNFAIILIYVIFILLEENLFPRKIDAIFRSQTQAKKIKTLLNKIGQAIDRYFYIKTVMSLLTGVLGYVLLLIFKVDFPVLWAFIIFLFNYVPYVGSFVATLLPATFAVFQFGAFLPFVWIYATIQGVQILVGNYIEPRIMGSSLNLSPLVVILALAFFGIIWGVTGMIISIPVLSMFTIITAQFPETKNIAILLTSNGDLSQTQVENN